MALWYVCVLGTGLGVGGPMGGGVPISGSVNLSVSWSRCVCVGDRAGQVGAAMSTIDWCVRPLALTSMSQQCVTLTLSGAELLCFVRGKEGFGGADLETLGM